MELLETSAMISSSDQDFFLACDCSALMGAGRQGAPTRSASADSACHMSEIGAGTCVDWQEPCSLL